MTSRTSHLNPSRPNPSQHHSRAHLAGKPTWGFTTILLLTAGLLLSVTLAVMLGPVAVAPGTIWRIALSHLPWLDQWIPVTWTKPEQYIVWEIRFPRVLLGVIVGAGLAVTGATIQALIRNSLADPYILGVSSGASVTATLVIVFGAFGFLGRLALPLSAFIGSLAAMLMVFALARVAGSISTTRLLLAGVAVSMMLSAVTSFIVTTAPNEKGIRDAMYWMMGSLAGAQWDTLFIPSLIVVVGTAVLLTRYRSLNALLTGEETAVTLGVNVQAFRVLLVVVASLLTGAVVSVSGSIGFVGLMIPHIVRLVVGSDHRRVLPVSLLAGAIFVVWADVCARLVLAPQELPIGIVTAVCGGPFFVWLLRRSSYSFGGEK
ncbi:iron ABC transporter permease [Paenibacillus polymyxa]|uniref:Iron ABC transporter permease n=1 Tax=Paenibacillus polymyxa TaxID=1406 RepID=A0A8I1LPN3_PAEPO|nr:MULTISPECIES: iron ABC transporter permease [Paenibacillus]KAF6574103.1 iron ABC transporter permease [Paenibacillus sp. EKM206P]KAF6588574.1 iron ABC transporter permease [Paenibacillus sp. EKM205P]MBM0632769.1 iron ABC transporter permease [Paenibacillus polymyxa]